ncbi:MAG: RICIN domain-containing protein [Methylococcales bacterium]
MLTTEKKGAAAPAASTGELNLGPYFIQHMIGSHYVLDVNGDGASTSEGTQVIAYGLKPQGNSNQQWQFVPAGPETPGWWYLQTLMGTDYVMTLQPHTMIEPRPVVMLPKGLTDADSQLWSLQPTEKLGYWYIQSKYGASNAQAPLVIGLTGEQSAVASPISFTEFEKQAWGFRPVYL